MSRPVAVLVAFLVLIVLVLVGLASINTARTPIMVQKDMLHAAPAQ